MTRDETGRSADDTYRWECPECEAINELAPAVVELCVEHWTSCDECGEEWAINLAGKP